MGRALFVGMSVAFFTAYSLVTSALLIPNDQITPITSTSGFECVTQGEGDSESCIEDDPRTRIWLIGPFIEAAANVLSVGADMFSGFIQVITFQASGLEAASVVTLLIFGPLAFVNAFIVFSAIRGS